MGFEREDGDLFSSMGAGSSADWGTASPDTREPAGLREASWVPSYPNPRGRAHRTQGGGGVADRVEGGGRALLAQGVVQGNIAFRKTRFIRRVGAGPFRT